MPYCKDKKDRLGKKSGKQDIPKSKPIPCVLIQNQLISP